MSSNISFTSEYKQFLTSIKTKIYSAQIKAALSVNKELLMLYWDIGKSIVEQQKKSNWGDGFIDNLSNDLVSEYPSISGFSASNLFAIRRWYVYYMNQSEKVLQLVIEIPWGHNLAVISKLKNINEAIFYIQKTIENNWSRNILIHQIESDLYSRVGKIQNNFEITLPRPQSDLANQTLKDPYIFDFLTIEEKFAERKLEGELIDNITKFLLEMGKGFAFIGKQYHLDVDENDFYIDLLFYHTKIKCYIAIDLKTGKFIPEYLGKMNFYLAVLDDKVKDVSDNPSIGLVLCKTKNQVVVEYALRNTKNPIGVAAYTLQKKLPKSLEKSLPSEKELQKIFQ